MLPLCCPDNSVTLSGCFRNQCPDVAEICTKGQIAVIVIASLFALSFFCSLINLFTNKTPVTTTNTTPTIVESIKNENLSKTDATTNANETTENELRKIEYEEIGIKGLTVYIYTDLKELDDLKIIADKYKNELFKDKSVFQIFFFNTKANAEHALKSSSLNYEDLVALIARYNFNSNTGYEKLYYDIEEIAFEEIPTIKLEIYEGPLYSEDGSTCYYRIKANVTGLPTPKVEFSKDDSLGNLGKNNAQINLYNKNETYTLIATAINSVGKASDSINLTWIEK